MIILSSIIYLFVQQNTLLKKRRKKTQFHKKKTHIFFKEPHDIFFFGVSKSHPPSSPTYHHHPTILFLDPPTLVRALQSWVRFPIHDRSETTSGRPTWRFFWGKVEELPKGSKWERWGRSKINGPKINGPFHWVFFVSPYVCKGYKVISPPII